MLNIRNSITASLAVLFCFSTIAAEAAPAAEAATAAETSNYSISYDDWSLFLSGAVLRARSTSRQRAKPQRSRTTGTKLSRSGGAKPHEANRIAFKALKDAHIRRLSVIQKDLAAVPTQIPLEQFSEDEQLAYWLNLHNITVVLELAQRYPAKNVKKIATGKKSIWDDAVLTVDGTPMSIAGMEEHILTNWDDPIVIYGLYMGAVGGPSLRHKAYTGDTVYQDLRYNARDFVNSLRGLKVFGGKAQASTFYERAQKHFPELETDLVAHMRTYAREDTLLELENIESLKVSQYDWSLTDVKRGKVYRRGQKEPDFEQLTLFAGENGAESATDRVVERPAALLLAAERREQRRSENLPVSLDDFTNELGGRVVSR